MDADEILREAEWAFKAGYGSLVLQSGEQTGEAHTAFIEEVLKRIHAFGGESFGVTLSLGEQTDETYRRWREAGAHRYLLRIETSNPALYAKLHPADHSWERRRECLRSLRRLGYQVGSGFMVGSPFRTTEKLMLDLRFLQEFHPEMVGVGPFIPHHDTPFKDEKAGSVDITLKILSIVRLILPEVLLPATTALGTADAKGREKGILAGANVVMPNLSPTDVREKYLLYDNKICTGDEAAECIRCMSLRVSKVGYEVVQSRGDHINTIPSC